jgi:hypothetical protein
MCENSENPIDEFLNVVYNRVKGGEKWSKVVENGA